MGLFSNKENEIHSFEQTIEKLRADYAGLEKVIIAKDEEIKQLKGVIESLSKSEPQNDTVIVEPIHTEGNKPNEQVPPTTAPTIDYTPALEAINASLKELTAKSDEMKTMIGYRDIQDENLKAMHKELEKFRGNFYAKITQPYLMAMLDLHKRFFETYAHFDHLDNSESDMNQLYIDLMKQFKSAVDALENRIYNDFGVEYYVPEEGEDFNPKMHQAFEVITTGNEFIDKKIAKVIYGGFRDIDTERILRPARIACYKYQLITE